MPRARLTLCPSQLLNTTVSSLAITLNSILTACYHACYEEGVSDDDELILVTAPISATSEVEALYTAGLIDWQAAIPAALHSLGCTSTEITEALRRRHEREDKVEETRTATETEASLVANDQARAQTEKTRAETEKTLAETKEVGKPPPGPADSSGST